MILTIDWWDSGNDDDSTGGEVATVTPENRNKSDRYFDNRSNKKAYSAFRIFPQSSNNVNHATDLIARMRKNRPIEYDENSLDDDDMNLILPSKSRIDHSRLLPRRPLHPNDPWTPERVVSLTTVADDDKESCGPTFCIPDRPNITSPLSMITAEDPRETFHLPFNESLEAQDAPTCLTPAPSFDESSSISENAGMEERTPPVTPQSRDVTKNR